VDLCVPGGMVPLVAIDRRRATELLQYETTPESYSEPEHVHGTSVDHNRRIQILRPRDPSDLRICLRLWNRNEDATKRPYYQGRSATDHRLPLAAGGSPSPVGGLVEAEHLVHRKIELDDQERFGLSLSQERMPRTSGRISRTPSGSPSVLLQLCFILPHHTTCFIQKELALLGSVFWGYFWASGVQSDCALLVYRGVHV